MSKKTKKTKSSYAEVDLRVGLIVSMILKGASRRHILQYTSKLDWGLSDRQVDTYIKKARNEIHSMVEADTEKLRNQTIARYENIFMLTMAQKQYKDAMTALDKISDITGLKNFKQELDINLKNVSELSDDELSAIIES